MAVKSANRRFVEDSVKALKNLVAGLGFNQFKEQAIEESCEVSPPSMLCAQLEQLVGQFRPTRCCNGMSHLQG
jgi:hypothetical protein